MHTKTFRFFRLLKGDLKHLFNQTNCLHPHQSENAVSLFFCGPQRNFPSALGWTDNDWICTFRWILPLASKQSPQQPDTALKSLLWLIAVYIILLSLWTVLISHQTQWAIYKTAVERAEPTQAEMWHQGSLLVPRRALLIHNLFYKDVKNITGRVLRKRFGYWEGLQNVASENSNQKVKNTQKPRPVPEKTRSKMLFYVLSPQNILWTKPCL